VQAQLFPEIARDNAVAQQGKAPEAPAATRLVGIHTSIAGGVGEALERASRLRCTTMQIFSASPRMWTDGRQAIDAEAAGRFGQRRSQLGIGPLVIHANYLINLAAPAGKTQARTILGFRGEIERALALGAEYLVVHPGSRLDQTIDTAIGQISRSLRESAAGLALGRLRILIEITAGQGSAVGSRIEELRAILEACAEMDLGVCLDAAHLFAAGYEIQQEAGLEKTIAQIDREIGLERVRVVHMNDSKPAFASHVDRHEHLGQGQIGLDALRRIVNHPGLAACAFILETPIDRPGDDWRNVQALWWLAGVEWEGPAEGGDAMADRRGAKTKTEKRKG